MKGNKSPEKSYRSLDMMLRQFEERGKTLKQKSEEVAALTKEANGEHWQLSDLSNELSAFQHEHQAGPQPETTSLKRRRGIASNALVEREELRVIKYEQLGLFDSFPIDARNEFPTLLARLPIFPPLDREKQKKKMDKDNAFVFHTPFGQGRRHGPPVTTDDEDRLIALMRLRSRKVIGEGPRLPIPLTGPQYHRDDNGNLNVHWVCCTIVQIHEEMGISNAGENYETTLQCLKRLAAIVLEIETNKQSLYFGQSTKGTSFKLVDIVWESYQMEGIIKAQFSPLVAHWLEQQATYLNWDVRRKLKSRNARAVHRFLSTQPKFYEREMAYIAKAIDWEGDRRRMKGVFSKILKQLVNLNWLKDYEITGTGRKEPFRIKTWRN